MYIMYDVVRCESGTTAAMFETLDTVAASSFIQLSTVKHKVWTLYWSTTVHLVGRRETYDGMKGTRAPRRAVLPLTCILP